MKSLSSLSSFFLPRLLVVALFTGWIFSCATVSPPQGLPPKEASPLPDAPEKSDSPPPQEGPPEEEALSPWPRNAAAAVSLTFDDGTLDHYTTAFPILEEFGVRGTFFLIAGEVEKGFWWDGTVERPLMSWDQAREMAKAGHEMGSHGYRHRDMKAAWERGIYSKTAGLEFEQAQRKIEGEIGLKVASYAWPYWRSVPQGTAPGLGYYQLLRDGVAEEEAYYRLYGSESLMPGKPGLLLSFAVLPDQDPQLWRRIGTWVKERGGWWILCFHGITPKQAAKGRADGLPWRNCSSEGSYKPSQPKRISG